MANKTETNKGKGNSYEIIRGRMPVQVVKMIRFHSDPEMSRSAIAALYRTTVGKVNDILKGSNFSYVTEDFKPTEEQLAAAKEYIAKCENDELTKLVDSFEVATEEEAAKFEEARIASRKPRKKAGESDTQNEGTDNAGAGADAGTDADADADANEESGDPAGFDMSDGELLE